MIRTLLALCLAIQAAILTISPVKAAAPENPAISSSAGSGEDAELHWQQLPTGERERLKRLYNRYQELPTEQREMLQNRLRYFRQLPAEEQQRLRERYRVWQSLPPEERERIRNTYQHYQKLSPERQKELREEMHKARDMDPADRMMRHRELRHNYMMRHGGR